MKENGQQLPDMLILRRQKKGSHKKRRRKGSWGSVMTSKNKRNTGLALEGNVNFQS